jgi:hypothetical protein
MRFNTHGFLAGISLVLGLLLNGAWVTEVYAERSTAFSSNHKFCKNQIGGEFFARTELFFGLSKPDGSVVNEEQFQSFIDMEITPRFPEGMTLIAGTGQFMGKKGTIIKENSKLLVLIYPFNNNRNKAIEEIRHSYMNMFQQESVLRVDEQSCVSF